MAVSDAATAGVVGGSILAGVLGGAIVGGPIGAFLGFFAGLFGGLIAQGNMEQQDAAAEAARIEAENLRELSEEGGYYDQVLAALQTELDDIEADRAAASTNLNMTLDELGDQATVSKLQTAAAVAGQVVQGLSVARQGAEGEGQIKAAAGAGGVAVGSGSTLRVAASISRAVSRQVAVANAGIATTREQGSYEQSVIRNNMVRARMNYSDTLRALDTREAQATAQTTLTEFQQETGGEQAGVLESQADWMQGPGMVLTGLGGIMDTAGAAISIGSRFSAPAAPTATPFTGWGGTGAWGSAHGYPSGNLTPSFAGGGVRTEFATGGSY